MADWTDGFPALIAPHSPESFFAEHWERGPLHLRHGEDFVDGLFDLDDLDELLTGSGLRYPSFRLLVDGREAHPDTYTHRSMPWGTGSVAHFIDYMRALALIRGGATVVLEQIQRIWPALAELTRHMELALGARTQTNAYMTPPRSQGLLPHYDLQDVYVLQTAGRKHWRVHVPHVRLPVRGQECPVAGVEPGEQLLDVVLEPGDMLYLPRGTVHYASTLDETSLHVSLSAVPVTTIDVLRELVDAATEDVRLRRGYRLDLHGPNEGSDEDQDELQATLRDLAGVADLDGLLDRLARQVAGSRMPLLGGVLADLARRDTVGLDTVVMRREGIVWRAEALGDRVVLAFHGRQLELPWHAIGTARFLGTSGPFAVRDLAGELTDEQRLGMVRTLVGEGFLTVVEED
ncbi:MAG: hypothetical protein H6742_20500 [Alphaproteobacteria bacterium]|nr:hypothetical protein [Alphaproteobacteria bacterium]